MRILVQACLLAAVAEIWKWFLANPRPDLDSAQKNIEKRLFACIFLSPDARKFMVHFGARGSRDQRGSHVAVPGWPAHVRAVHTMRGQVDDVRGQSGRVGARTRGPHGAPQLATATHPS